MKLSLQESLEGFIAPVYGKTTRTTDTYRTVARRCRRNLARLIPEYHSIENDQQEEIRNEMDDALRRYHEYCIEQRDGMGAHYHEIGADDETDFEHLIPAARIRDLLLADTITIDQALNAPTVVLSRAKHRALKEAGWASKTPDMWRPFRRYSQVFTAQYQTHDGTPVDPEIWTLERHYQYFQHLVLG
jgi:hypothetical protein